MPNEDKREWEAVPALTPKVEGTIEARCKGVIIGVGYDSTAFLIHWPRRKGFCTPMDYDMMESAALSDNCFDDYPEEPGVYSCLVEFDYSPGDGWETDPDWTFYVREAKRIELPFIDEYIDTEREMFEKSFERPSNFFQLSGKKQWKIDKALGILDWKAEGLSEEDRKRVRAHYNGDLTK